MLPPDREADWQKRLPGINLHGESIPAQLLRIRNLNLVLTVVAAFIGVIPLTIFTAFGHPGIGLIVFLVWMIPICVKWSAYLRLQSSARRYFQDRSID